MNRYNRSLLFALLALSLAGTAFAQPNISRDTTHYNDEELYEGDGVGSAAGYSWIGGGLIVGMHLPSLTDFNANIAQKFIHQDLKGQAIMIGGQGFLPLPWVKNLRIGGIGMSGNSNVCCVPDTTTLGQPVMRSLTYHVGYGALTVDYSFLNTSRFHILGGLELGLGAIDIIAQQAANRNTFDISSEFDSPSTNITHTYHSGFFIVKPQVEFEYAPLRWLMVRLAAGYQVTSMGTWTVDDKVSFTKDAGALTKVNGNGPVFHFGVFLGFF
ncbi:MAG: hypothetical protein ACHQM6_00890 [Candidatus Kapaibacterium sp.]